MAYCTKCGSELGEGLQFCTLCGASVEAKAQSAAPGVPTEPAIPGSPQSASATSWQSVSSIAPQRPAADNKSGCMPTVLIVLGVLVLVAALGIGGLVYAGYKVKQKAVALLKCMTTPDATTPGENKPGSPAATLPAIPRDYSTD